ncbi:hypothetical protein J4437_01925 [Candidatus Woesearchaeota archaeon]|nr:hypothetical protein [Candidatus Woesearchaeota archaeon]
MDNKQLTIQKGRTILGLASLLLGTSLTTGALAEEIREVRDYKDGIYDVHSYRVYDDTGKQLRHVMERDWNEDGLVDEIIENIYDAKGQWNQSKRTYHCNEGAHKGLTYITTTTFLPNEEGFIILDEADFNGDGKIDKTEKYFRSGVTGEEKKLPLDNQSN